MAQKLSEQLSKYRISRTQRQVYAQGQKEYYESLRRKAEGIREQWGNITSLQDYQSKYSQIPLELLPFFLTPSELKNQIDAERQAEKQKAQDKLQQWQQELIDKEERLRIAQERGDRQGKKDIVMEIKELNNKIRYFDVGKIDEGYSTQDLIDYASQRAYDKTKVLEAKQKNIELEQTYIKQGYTPVLNKYDRISGFLPPESQVVTSKTARGETITYTNITSPVPEYLASKKTAIGYREADIQAYQQAFSQYEKVGFEALPESKRQILAPDYEKKLSTTAKEEYIPIYAQGTIEGVGGKIALFSPALVKSLTERGILKTSKTGEFEILGTSGDIEMRRIVTYGGVVDVRGKKGYKYGVESTKVDPVALSSFIEMQNLKAVKEIEAQKIADDVAKKFGTATFETRSGKEEIYWSTYKTLFGKTIRVAESKSIAMKDLSKLSPYERAELAVGYSFGIFPAGALPSGLSIEQAEAINRKVKLASETDIRLEKVYKASSLATTATGGIIATTLLYPTAKITLATLKSWAGVKATAGLISAGALGIMGLDVAGKGGRFAKFSETDKELFINNEKLINEALKAPNEFVYREGFRFSDPEFIKNLRSFASKVGTERVGSKQERLYEFGYKRFFQEQGVAVGDVERLVAITQAERVNRAINTIEKAVFVEALTEAYGRGMYFYEKASMPKKAFMMDKLTALEAQTLTKNAIDIKYKSYLLDVATKNIVVGGFAEGSLGDIIYSMESGKWNPLRTAGVGLGGSLIATGLGRTIVKSSMKGEKGLGYAKLSAGYALDFPLEKWGDMFIDWAEKLSPLNIVGARPRIITPSFINVKGTVVDEEPFTYARKPTDITKISNDLEIRQQRLMNKINNMVKIDVAVPPAVSASLSLDVYERAVSLPDYTVLPLNVYSPLTIPTPTEVDIPDYALTPSLTSLSLPLDIPTEVSTPVSIPSQVNLDVPLNVNVPVVVPDLNFPELFGGFYKGRRKFQRKKYAVGQLPDFTARVLGIERETAKNMADLMRKINKLQTGLEIRRGLKLA